MCVHLLVQINNKQCHARYIHKNVKITGFVLKNKICWQFEVENKFLQTTVLGYIFIDIQTKH